jgi:hypothetical protein
VVDTRDYLVWRKTFGQHVTAWSGADGNGDAVIDGNDYNIWKSNFGATGSGSGNVALTAVPESSNAIAAIVTMLGVVSTRKKKLVIH